MEILCRVDVSADHPPMGQSIHRTQDSNSTTYRMTHLDEKLNVSALAHIPRDFYGKAAFGLFFDNMRDGISARKGE